MDMRPQSNLAEVQLADESILFDERFLERHAGAIITDPEVAIVELVANAWDAWATEVAIGWAEKGEESVFSIRDNGRGMTEAQFRRRWKTIDYNRLNDEGSTSMPPPELEQFQPREAYGRNGKGRHAAFRFGDPYLVRTWREGVEVTFEVRRATEQPFELNLLSTREGVAGHGTEIRTTKPAQTFMTSAEAREALGMRFLSDPNFSVIVDGKRVTFADVPQHQLRTLSFEVATLGTVVITVIDAQRADKTTRHHGIAWWVQNRLVGKSGWTGFDHERILDGRTAEAKRFSFIVRADFLAERNAVLPDWTGFLPGSPAWVATKEAVECRIREELSEHTAIRRAETKAQVRDRLGTSVAQLAPISRDRWDTFVDKVIDNCPSINADEVEQVAGILANLELASSKYGLLQQLHDLSPGELDAWNQILSDWTVRTAKLALDEIQSRLKLIAELDRKLRDQTLDEVADLQPLLERSLWVFGPEFESLEFTSNRGMTEVIRRFFKGAAKGSLLRPDFVMLEDGSVGFYSRDSHDLGHEVSGVSRLVIAEIKRVGVTIGSVEKEQPWRYVKELIDKGLLTESATVTAYVLGSKVDPTETGDDTRWDKRVLIRPMSYETFVRRAEKRLLGLRSKLKDAPFLTEAGLDADQFIEPAQSGQVELNLLLGSAQR